MKEILKAKKYTTAALKPTFGRVGPEFMLWQRL